MIGSSVAFEWQIDEGYSSTLARNARLQPSLEM